MYLAWLNRPWMETDLIESTQRANHRSWCPFTLGHRFGVVASVTVPVLIILGGYMGYQLVGSFAALTGTSYGQALIIKVLLVGLLLGLAAANKLRFVPALRIGDPVAARHLSKSISVEWLIILAVLGTTAVLTTHLTLPT